MFNIIQKLLSILKLPFEIFTDLCMLVEHLLALKVVLYKHKLLSQCCVRIAFLSELIYFVLEMSELVVELVAAVSISVCCFSVFYILPQQW